MNKLAQIKLLKQIKEIRKSTESCEQFLTAYQNSEIENPDNVVAAEFKTVIQHQKNMVRFFGILEQQINK